jgi:quinol monooxygenase YgiN
MTYVVCAKWTAQPGRESDVRASIEALVGPSRAEPGLLAYVPHEDPEDPSVFFIYEEYVDAAAYQAHAASEHFQELAVGRAIPLLQSRERLFLRPFGTE